MWGGLRRKARAQDTQQRKKTIRLPLGVGRIELIQESGHGIFIVLNALCWGHGGGWSWAKQPISDFGIFRIYCSRIFAISIISRWRNIFGFWAGWTIRRQRAFCDQFAGNAIPISLLLRINAACPACGLFCGYGGQWGGRSR